ncbi:uncharacterized protein C17orf53 homolog [Chanos chanos]|uniref:Uncharacterized protein C17orf53 homolog n=1 Tax=Chanos chanos TaxID=29144 RepID=A0A6J2WZT8_CHACN|nr:uncharacterized protein C17orf53 homolog [Chanos chanos]
MTAMACKWNSLFSVGEEFDDEDLLEADWTVTPKPSSAAAAVSSSALPSAGLRAPTAPGSSNTLRDSLSSGDPRGKNQEPGGSVTPDNGSSRISITGLKALSNPAPPSLSPSISTAPPPCLRVPLGGSKVTSSVEPQPSARPKPGLPLGFHGNALPQDDFDDWDVDLEDLDEMVPQVPPGRAPVTGPWGSTDDNGDGSPSKRMRASACGTGLPAGPSLRGTSSGAQAPAPPHLQTPASLPGPPQSPGFAIGVRASAPPCFTNPVTPRPVRPPSSWQGGLLTPPSSVRPTGALFQVVSPAPSPVFTPRPLHTPVLTNHLVQLVSAANKTPQRPRGDVGRSKTRRFPGPAGVLPQQPIGRSLDDVVVTVPQTPAHGAVARLHSEVSSSQTSEEEEVSMAAWQAMKAEMGLDEKNPSCFLNSYSVVMVLRKAALRQLVKNKVPNMAIILKSILHTHTDAKAVFRDPTGEMQGTVHRRLLEDRQSELKPGAVLLLKQVGVFSPSHRNHYLNVTPNNLLKIYPPDGVFKTSTKLSQHALEPVSSQCGTTGPAEGAVVSQMELRFEDDDEEEKDRAESQVTFIPANTASCANKMPQKDTGIGDTAFEGIGDSETVRALTASGRHEYLLWADLLLRTY